MRKIEIFLNDYGCIIRFGLIFMWLLWALQLFNPLKLCIKQNIYELCNHDAVQQAHQERQLYDFVWGKIAKAEKMGKNYGPNEYFADLKEIHTGEQLYKTRIATGVNQLFMFVKKNIEKGYFTENDVSEACDKYKYWLKSGDYYGEQARQELQQIGWRKISQNVFWWFVIMYLRTIFLIIPFYLIRMNERRGILETILAEKRKFVFAVMGWIFYFTRYPSNIIREIRVEAELRRIGDFFRILTVEEKELIKKIANSDIYLTWISRFRQNYCQLFQRGLILALMATILFYLIMPILMLRSANAFCNKEQRYICLRTSMPIGLGNKAFKILGGFEELRVESIGIICQKIQLLFFELVDRIYIVLLLYKINLAESISHIPIHSFTFYCKHMINDLFLKGERYEKNICCNTDFYFLFSEQGISS